MGWKMSLSQSRQGAKIHRMRGTYLLAGLRRSLVSIETTLLKALKVLKLCDIPHNLSGGFAVQEYGYPRPMATRGFHRKN